MRILAKGGIVSKRAPSTTQLLVIVGFALSCFGILLFLWVTFGGPTPFRAKPYQIKVPFNEATQLAEQSDVRISGVNVGKVQGIELAPNQRQALATVDINDKYAPLPKNTRAILRTKTLLGETYIELTPGSNEAPQMADGGTVPEAQVAESVQLDEIFRTFDPETRSAFQRWMQESAIAINGQGQSLSYALGQLEPTFTEFDRLFRTLDSQRLAVSQLFRDGATTFRALRGREGELASLIDSSNAVFQTTARRDRDIEALFRAFPTFLDESRTTVARLKTFAQNTDPLMRQLVPAAEQLSPTLVAIAKLSPESKGLFEGLRPVIARAPEGFPALRKIFRDEFPPLLRAVDPFLRNLNPVLTGLKLYRREFAAFFGNVAATFNATLPVSAGPKPHYLRAVGPILSDTLSTYPGRLTLNRNSAYSPPKWAEGLASGALPSFGTQQCSSGRVVTLDPESGSSAALKERVKQVDPNGAPLPAETIRKESEVLFNNLKRYAFNESLSSSGAAAPPCAQQAPFTPIFGGGPATIYQHAFEQSQP
ncbi:MAG TPA: MlaD family protein [Solirubrobacterales bacterium]|nr:MlaD family protein [Solirubrobacterales bacterium]